MSQRGSSRHSRIALANKSSNHNNNFNNLVQSTSKRQAIMPRATARDAPDDLDQLSPEASASPIDQNEDIHLPCSQCKLLQPIETFPIRLATLVPFRICKLHTWYWTETRQSTWAPSTVYRIREIFGFIKARVEQGVRHGEEEAWVVKGTASSMMETVETIAKIGTWTTSKVAIRKSRTIAGPMPPVSHVFRFQPSIVEGPEISTESLKITFTHHSESDKFVVLLKMIECGRKNWRKDRTGSLVKGATADGEMKPMTVVKHRASRDAVTKRRRNQEASDEDQSGDREKDRRPSLQQLQELQSQLDSGDPLPPPPVRGPIRRVAPHLVTERVQPPAQDEIEASAAKRQRTSAEATSSHALVHTLKNFLSKELEALNSSQAFAAASAPRRALSSTSARHQQEHRAIAAMVSLTTSSRNLAINDRLAVPQLPPKSPGRHAIHSLESEIDELASPPALPLSTSPVRQSPLAQSYYTRHASDSPTNAGSSAIDTESEASEEDDETDDDGFFHDDNDEDGGYAGGFGGDGSPDGGEGEELDTWLTGFVIGELGGRGGERGGSRRPAR